MRIVKTNGVFLIMCFLLLTVESNCMMCDDADSLVFIESLTPTESLKQVLAIRKSTLYGSSFTDSSLIWVLTTLETDSGAYVMITLAEQFENNFEITGFFSFDGSYYFVEGKLLSELYEPNGIVGFNVPVIGDAIPNIIDFPLWIYIVEDGSLRLEVCYASNCSD